MRERTDDSKRNQLARRHALHPNPEKVTDPLFQDDPFFDPCDVVQVKYEMLRAVRVEGRMVSQAAAHFGFSRPTFYQARGAFERAGMPGLLPAKKGPRRAHKLSATVLAFGDRELEAEPSLTMTTLAERIHEGLGITVHPRSIKRALARRAKKTRESAAAQGTRDALRAATRASAARRRRPSIYGHSGPAAPGPVGLDDAGRC